MLQHGFIFAISILYLNAPSVARYAQGDIKLLWKEHAMMIRKKKQRASFAGQPKIETATKKSCHIESTTEEAESKTVLKVCVNGRAQNRAINLHWNCCFLYIDIGGVGDRANQFVEISQIYIFIIKQIMFDVVWRAYVMAWMRNREVESFLKQRHVAIDSTSEEDEEDEI